MSAFAAGCAIPFATVPSRIEVGGGTALGLVPDRRGPDLVRQDPSHLFMLRAILMPLAAIPPLADRSFDVGFGYGGEFYGGGFGRFHHHEFSFEGNYFLDRSLDVRTGSLTRIGLIGRGSILVDDFSGVTDRGSGFTAGVLLERVHFSRAGDRRPSRPGELRSHVPVARSLSPFRQGGWIGESGVGLAVTGSLRSLANETYGVLLVSVTFRLPLGGGIIGLWPLRRQSRSGGSEPPVQKIYD